MSTERIRRAEQAVREAIKERNAAWREARDAELWPGDPTPLSQSRQALEAMLWPSPSTPAPRAVVNITITGLRVPADDLAEQIAEAVTEAMSRPPSPA